MTDWSKRPLTKEHLEYAANDVWVLIDLYEKLKGKYRQVTLYKMFDKVEKFELKFD